MSERQLMDGTTAGKGLAIGDEVDQVLTSGRGVVYARQGSCKVLHGPEDFGDSVPGNGPDTYVSVNLFAGAVITVRALEAGTEVYFAPQAIANINPR